MPRARSQPTPPAARETTRQPARRWRSIAALGLPLLALAAIGLASYRNSFTVPLLFDDNVIRESPSIKQLWPPWKIAQSPSQSPLSSRPVVSLSLAVNFAWGGYEVAGYHVFNLTVHILCSWVLFGIVRRTLQTGSRAASFPGRTASLLAFATAALWLVHPLQPEAVTYIIQRTELLMGLFYLLTLYAAIRAWDSSRPAAWSVPSVVCCAAGMASKEVMVSAPIMVVLYDLAFRELPWRPILARRWPLYAGLASTWIVLIALMVFDPRSDTVGFHLGVSVWQCVQTESWALMHYLRLAVWPNDLSLDYGPWFDVTTPQAATGFLTVGVLIAITLWGWWRHRWLGFLGTWMLLILAPTTSIVPIETEPVAERRMYLPLAAIAVLAVLGVWQTCRRIERGLASPPQRQPGWLHRTLCLVVLAAIGIALGLATSHRNDTWQTAINAWRDVVQKRPDNIRGYDNLAGELNREKQYAEAERHSRQALELDDQYANAYDNLGSALWGQQRYDEAMVALQKAIELEPKHHEAYYDLGLVYRDQGKHDQALEQFRKAIEIRSQHVFAHCELALELSRRGELVEAVEHYRKALEITPRDPVIQYHLGLTLAEQGKFDEALEAYQASARLDPKYVDPRLKIGILLLNRGDAAAAARWFNEILDFEPKNKTAQQWLEAARRNSTP